MEILRIENLSFSYPNSQNKAIDNVSFSVNEGEFVVICGESGCGKTTLLKMLKKQLSPHGEKDGEVYYRNIPLENLEDKVSACDIGFVLQNPETQIVSDKVWHELAFGLENMGVEPNVIRRRVGEMASYFGIEQWFRKDVEKLSGGEKQILNLASVMVMQPKVLILDEPTSQLDPISAMDFISTLKKMNDELGITIILVEHRLEEVFPIADKVMIMEDGQVLIYDKPKNIGLKLKNIDNKHKMLSALPSAVRIYNELNVGEECPLTVKDARKYLKNHFKNDDKFYKAKEYKHSEDIAIELNNIWFRYEKKSDDVLKSLNLKIYNSEIACILGGNGTGKTTALNIICGLEKPYKGKIKINGQKFGNGNGDVLYRHDITMLPQNPTTVFIKDTVKEDYIELLKQHNVNSNDIESKIAEVSQKLGIQKLLEKHPFDLSGGEQQKCALAKMLLLNPKILLLDEPTKGYDAYSKKVLCNILKSLKSNGMTILIVTHDIEFAAENADRSALLFDGEIVSIDTPEKFFSENHFYTTAANRISRGFYDGAVTCDEVAQMCKRNGEKDG